MRELTIMTDLMYDGALYGMFSPGRVDIDTVALTTLKPEVKEALATHKCEVTVRIEHGRVVHFTRVRAVGSQEKTVDLKNLLKSGVQNYLASGYLLDNFSLFPLVPDWTQLNAPRKSSRNALIRRVFIDGRVYIYKGIGPNEGKYIVYVLDYQSAVSNQWQFSLDTSIDAGNLDALIRGVYRLGTPNFMHDLANDMQNVYGEDAYALIAKVVKQ